jgi:hypothetical protein
VAGIRIDAARSPPDLAQVHVTLRRLDLRLDTDPPADPAVRLDLRQHRVDERDVVRRRRLGQHDQVDSLARALHHLDQVPVGPLRVEAVDAHQPRLAAEVERVERVHDGAAADRLLARGHAVLEVEAHGVGVARGALGHHCGARPRHEQQAARQARHRIRHHQNDLGIPSTCSPM